MGVLYSAHGQSLSLQQWGDVLGVQWKTLWQRIKVLGLAPEAALVEAIQRKPPSRNPNRTAQINCASCGAAVVIPRCRAERGEKCCSTECRTALRKKKSEESADSRRRQCAQCRKSFVPRRWQLDQGDGHLCSRTCRGEYIRLRNWVDGKSKTAVQIRGKAARAARIGGARLPNGTRHQLYENQKGKCAFCHCSLKSGYQLDHIVPLAKGGKHEVLNLQLLCKPCNLRKRAIDPIAFAQLHGRLL